MASGYRPSVLLSGRVLFRNWPIRQYALRRGIASPATTSTPLSSPRLTRPSTIPHLRESAQSYFAKQNYKHVVWIGVHRSFARDDKVNLISVTKRASGEKETFETVLLGEELVNVWGRTVWHDDIQVDVLGSFFQISALLCSRTIFGSERNEYLVKLRNDAMEILVKGQLFFSELSSEIEAIRFLTTNLDFKHFQNSEDLRNEIRDRTMSILNRPLEIEQPLQSKYWLNGGQSAEVIKRALDEKVQEEGALENTSSDYWKALWAAVTDDGAHGDHLANIEREIYHDMVPSLVRIQQESQRIKELACNDAPGEEIIHDPNKPKPKPHI
ncbi:MAG: hypothetical protein M1812_001375 [Candelaria pacifica]|nr:MAG: hypothetical protein M1812_001375 [Candelaria pacifica]